ncbi:hypothetical protein L3X38_024951 [Prunus dulcis]|uniref:Retrotransposon gag domain-containing protein n=1 Tax=Prunus dulcis TaxID=3755 RepID=A0AAD4W0V8_PRUDU|nr:hypothetical protein L3X38_024951 [Prunus dulcis]
MEPSLLNMFHTLPTAKEIWDTVNHMFFDGSDISQLYELQRQATHLKQEGRPVSTYVSELNEIWLELDNRSHFQMKCADDMKTLQVAIMADHVYVFLAGLDDTHDKVHSDILRSTKVPSIKNVFFMVRREAQRQITMLGSGIKIGEPAAVFASKNNALVSRPTDWEKERRRLKREQLDSKAHVAVVPTSVADITTRHGHLTTTPPSTLTAVSCTPTPPPLPPPLPPPPGNFGKAFHAHDTCDTGWIIDSRATDHMMYNFALFSTTLPPHCDHVRTVWYICYYCAIYGKKIVAVFKRQKTSFEDFKGGIDRRAKERERERGEDVEDGGAEDDFVVDATCICLLSTTVADKPAIQKYEQAAEKQVAIPYKQCIESYGTCACTLDFPIELSDCICLQKLTIQDSEVLQK